MACGIIVLNKPEGITSQSAVSRIKRIFGEKKAGHTGTLDPLATGVLPILLGRAVKASDYMLSSDKYYRAELTLGIRTDTEDTTGSILSRYEGELPSEEEVLHAVASFVGNIKQTPPMYSALKIDGRKLCDLARAGVTVEREARDITVHSIVAKKLSDSTYSLDVHCSKGTYIRTLCSDIGERLGVGGAMSALTRTRASIFTLEDALTLEELEAMSDIQRQEAVVPVERIFEDYTKVTLSPFFERLASCGNPIYLKKIGVLLPEGERVRLYGKGGFFAIGEVTATDEGMAIKPTKQFPCE